MFRAGGLCNLRALDEGVARLLKVNEISVASLDAKINPLSPPCIPPNPGFRDLSAKKQIPSSQKMIPVIQLENLSFTSLSLITCRKLASP